MLTALPQELLEEILLFCDPLDVAQVAGTCKRLHEVVYGFEVARGQFRPEDDGGMLEDTGSTRAFWREMYLLLGLDDLRDSVDWVGWVREVDRIDWKVEVQRVVRARTIAHQMGLCKGEEELREVMKTFLELVKWVKPMRTADREKEFSRNLVWVPVMLRGFLDRVEEGVSVEVQGNSEWRIPPKVQWDEETKQLHAQLHTLYGLTLEDTRKSRRLKSWAYVYDMRRYTYDNEFGPLRSDGSGRVNWECLQMIHHDISLHVVGVGGNNVEQGQGQDEGGEQDDGLLLGEDYEYAIFPMSMPFTQIVLPGTRAGEGIGQIEVPSEGSTSEFFDVGLNDGVRATVEGIPEGGDWAALEGAWNLCFCFCDHRDLMAYNHTATGDGPLDTSIFTSPDFLEVFRRVQVDIKVTRIAEDPAHPGRPIICFVGVMRAPSTSTMHGRVLLTPDGYLKWQMFSGEQGSSIWSCLGIQVGGIGSAFGVLGIWTTVFHDIDDPIGPFWMERIRQSTSNLI